MHPNPTTVVVHSTTPMTTLSPDKMADISSPEIDVTYVEIKQNDGPQKGIDENALDPETPSEPDEDENAANHPKKVENRGRGLSGNPHSPLRMQASDTGVDKENVPRDDEPKNPPGLHKFG